MQPLLRIIFFLLVCSPSVWADGKVYTNYEKVPPSIPYQRALIYHSEGTQTMVLQSRYVAETKGQKIGWVVPLPAVPEVNSMSAEKGSKIFQRLSLSTRMKEISIRNYIIGLTTLLAVLYIFIFLILRALSKSNGKRYKISSNICFFAAFVFILFVIFFISPRIGRINSSASILGEHDTGIYKVTIIEAENADDLMQWLELNDFKSDEKDVLVYQQHIDKGWCFAATTVKPETEWPEEGVKEDLFAPLIFRFAAKHPIYPLALTATAGQPTTVLIYLVSDQFYTAGDRMKLLFANQSFDSKKLETAIHSIDQKTLRGLTDEELEVAVKNQIIFSEIFRGITDLDYLMKFKQEFTPKQMEQDLEFRRNPKQKDFRATKVVW